MEKILEESRVKVLLPSQMHRIRELQVPADGKGYHFIRENSVHPSNSIDMTFQIGTANLQQSIRLNLLAHILSETFFHILRTEEQLGSLAHYNIFYLHFSKYNFGPIRTKRKFF